MLVEAARTVAMSRSELMREWLDALRSGHYLQGSGRLKNSREQYCCLGVAADAVFGVEWDRTDYGDFVYGTGQRFDGSYATNLSPEHSAVLGLDKSITEDEFLVLDGVAEHVAGRPVYLNRNNPSRESILMELNDAQNFTFEQIADFIEKAGWAND